MKKILAILCTATICLTAMAGCGGKKGYEIPIDTEGIYLNMPIEGSKTGKLVSKDDENAIYSISTTSPEFKEIGLEKSIDGMAWFRNDKLAEIGFAYIAEDGEDLSAKFDNLIKNNTDKLGEPQKLGTVDMDGNDSKIALYTFDETYKLIALQESGLLLIQYGDIVADKDVYDTIISAENHIGDLD